MHCIKIVMDFTYTTHLLMCIVVLYPVHHTVNTSKLRWYVISNIKLYEVLPQSQSTPAMTKLLLELFSPPSISSPSLPLRHIDHCNHLISHLVSGRLSTYYITMTRHILHHYHRIHIHEMTSLLQLPQSLHIMPSYLHHFWLHLNYIHTFENSSLFSHV